MRIPQLPQALQWDHNAHYHPWLLRQLPSTAVSALDVGCGAGALARRLAQRAATVDAVDSSAVMIDRASALGAPLNVRWLLGDVLDPTLPLRPDGYDVVTAVSSLHHLPLRPALTTTSALLRPGGVLVVVGLARPSSPADYAVGALGVVGNGLVGAALALRGRAGKPYDDGMPVRDPVTTLAEVRAAAAELLPGARIRRRLFFRYSLVWRRPDGGPSPRQVGTLHLPAGHRRRQLHTYLRGGSRSKPDADPQPWTALP